MYTLVRRRVRRLMILIGGNNGGNILLSFDITQTLANRTLALHLPGGRQLVVTSYGHSNAPAEYAIKEERRLRTVCACVFLSAGNSESDEIFCTFTDSR